MPEATVEQTLIIFKPDCVQRKLVGEVLARFERKGFQIRALTHTRLNPTTIERHYVEHVGKPFFGRIRSYMLSGPVVIAVLEGHRAVEVSRKMLGATMGFESPPGSIRGDYCNAIEDGNLVHASDSVDAAQREIEIHFGDIGLRNVA